MIWHDEFDGTKLDESKWVYRPDGKRKDGWWGRKAVSLDGKGHLVIKTFKEGDKVIDGCITTQGKFEHAFGYYVARIQFQKQPGHWSAFWITGPGVQKVGDEGRDGTEIDIMEKPWLDDRVQHTFHWDGYGKDHKSEGKVVKVPGVMEGWHTFAIWWKPDEYVFYVDGKETWRTKGGGPSPGARVHTAERRDRQMGGRHQEGQAARRVPRGLRAGVRSGGEEVRKLRMDRRHFIATLAAGAACGRYCRLLARNSRARLSAGQHRLAGQMPIRHRRSLDGPDRAEARSPLPFQKAVEAFDVKRFIDALVHAGADYLLFTAAHALQMLPAPHPVIDGSCPAVPASVT